MLYKFSDKFSDILVWANIAEPDQAALFFLYLLSALLHCETEL